MKGINKYINNKIHEKYPMIKVYLSSKLKKNKCRVITDKKITVNKELMYKYMNDKQTLNLVINDIISEIEI